jgi:hypothetical protein
MHPMRTRAKKGVVAVSQCEVNMMLKLLSGAELQAARKAAAERFETIATQYVPEGYTVEFRKSLSGRHYRNKKLIQAPRQVTRRSLYVFLHECAHAHLHLDRRPPVHVMEMEAEKWAHEKMREHGIAVPRKMTKQAKRYVASKIRRAIARGAKKIDRAASRYAFG